MVSITSESHFTGYIQHVTTDEHSLAVALFEEALNAGMEPESSNSTSGLYLVEFYAFDEELHTVLQAARATADAALIAQPKPLALAMRQEKEQV